jgi:hypothetical protein
LAFLTDNIVLALQAVLDALLADDYAAVVEAQYGLAARVLTVKCPIFRSVAGEAVAVLVARQAVVGAVLAGRARGTRRCHSLQALFEAAVVAAQIVAGDTLRADGRGGAGCALGGAAEALAGRLVVASHANAAGSRVQGSVLDGGAREAGEIA